MDGRDEMTSFYLNRGVSGLNSPPPGFKIQSNSVPSFLVEHNPSRSFPHRINTGAGAGGDGGGVVKKKRGRPRKYGPDGSHMALGLNPVQPGSPASVSPSQKKNRGRPKGSGWKQRLVANVGEWMNNSAGMAFTPHIIHVSTGEDVAEKILSFAQQRPRALCILSGNGAVSAVTLSQFTSSGGTVTYEGRFEILCLSGSYLLAETGGPHNRTGSLSISVCSGDGNVIGGAIGGRLIASSLVQVVVCSFLYGNNNVKAKTITDAPSTDKHNETSLTQSPVAIAWPPDSRTGLRNSHTEIDLTRG